MSRFRDLTDYAKIVFDENNGKINFHQFNSILKSFNGDLIRMSAKQIEKQYRLEFVRKLQSQGVSNPIIVSRLVQAYNISLSFAWAVVSKVNNEDEQGVLNG